MTMFMLINRLREFYQSKVTADINGELKTGMTEDEKKLLEKVLERLEND
jgi:DNA replication initiation complex subunit (GINS family)